MLSKSTFFIIFLFFFVGARITLKCFQNKTTYAHNSLYACVTGERSGGGEKKKQRGEKMENLPVSPVLHLYTFSVFTHLWL